jgi:hypothetical protein
VDERVGSWHHHGEIEWPADGPSGGFLVTDTDRYV